MTNKKYQVSIDSLLLHDSCYTSESIIDLRLVLVRIKEKLKCNFFVDNDYQILYLRVCRDIS